MATVTTPRVSGALTADNTKRVATNGTSGRDPWGDSWGDSWGLAWLRDATTASPAVDVASRIAETPAADNTPRVSLASLTASNTPCIGSAPTANNTKRVTLA